jgi:hypothetical protein
MEFSKVPKEDILVAEMLLTSAGNASKLVDSFSGWLLAGFGIATTLLLGQYDTMARHVCAHTIRWTLLLFGLSLVFALVEKYMALLIASAFSGAESSRATLSRHSDIDPNKLGYVLDQMEKSMYQPGRWFVHRSFEKAKVGDVISGPRKYLRLAQIQGLVMVSQIILILITTWMLGVSFRF